MKNNFFKYLFLAISLSLVTYNCNQDEPSFSDNGQTALSFQDLSFNLSIPQENLTLEIPVFITTLSGESRSFDVAITNATEGTGNEYSVGSVVIPANEYSGILSVDFFFDQIGGEDGDVKELELTLTPPDGAAAYNEVANISYFREIVCNDLELTILPDVYANETYWRLEQADGTIIQDNFFNWGSPSLAPPPFNLSFTLPDGEYVFFLGDTFGDGQVSPDFDLAEGSYLLKCSIITHASGSGAFAAPIAGSGPGTGPNSTEEATVFSVNQ